MMLQLILVLGLVDAKVGSTYARSSNNSRGSRFQSRKPLDIPRALLYS